MAQNHSRITNHESRTTKYDVVIIGAGHNGLTAAGLLAKKRRRVLVLERRSIVGGLAAGEEFHPGYRVAGLLHDTCHVRRSVIDSLSLVEHGLRLDAQPPAVLLPQQDGHGLRLSADSSEAATEIGAFSPRDAEQYGRFKKFIHRITKFVTRFANDLPPDVFGNHGIDWTLFKEAFALRRLGKADMTELLRVGPMCVADWLDEWFESDLLKAGMAAPAVYGTFMGPRSPGSAANLLLLECAAGCAVQGGPQALVSALERAARSNGADIRTEAEVREIQIDRGRACGVTLSSGESIEARAVAASCDPKHTLLDLLPKEWAAPAMERAILAYRTRGTAAKVHVALSAPLEFASRLGECVEYARIADCLDQIEKAFDCIKYGTFSEVPVLDIYVPTVSDPSLAPAGHSVVSILVHFAPFDLNGGWTDQNRQKLTCAVLDVLSKYAPGVAQSLVAHETLTPPDIAKRYGTTGGHIYHGEHSLDQMLVRPILQAARYATPIEGLFLCGSGSHPGGGISCAPGALAARRIAREKSW